MRNKNKEQASQNAEIKSPASEHDRIDHRVLAARQQHEVDTARERERTDKLRREVDARVCKRVSSPPFSGTGPAYDQYIGELNRATEEVCREMGIQPEEKSTPPNAEIGQIVLDDWILAEQILSSPLSETTRASIWEKHYLYADESRDTDDVVRAFALVPGMPSKIYRHILQAYPERPELVQAIAQYQDLPSDIRQLCDQAILYIQSRETLSVSRDDAEGIYRIVREAMDRIRHNRAWNDRHVLFHAREIREHILGELDKLQRDIERCVAGNDLARACQVTRECIDQIRHDHIQNGKYVNIYAGEIREQTFGDLDKLQEDMDSCMDKLKADLGEMQTRMFADWHSTHFDQN